MKNFFTIASIVFINISPVNAEQTSQTNERHRIDQIIKSEYIAAGANEFYDEKIKDVSKILDDHAENLKQSNGIYKNLDGGQWIEYDEHGNPYPVIALVKKYQSTQLFKNQISKNAKIIYVEYSINELTELQEKIYSLLIEEKNQLDRLIKSMGVDPKINKLSINVVPDSVDQALDFLEAEGFDINKINIQPDDSIYQKVGNLYSGSGTFIQQPSGYTFCSAGFVGRVDNSYDVAITAGHCIPAFAPGNVYLLTRANSQFTNPPLSTLGEFVGSKLANEYTSNNPIKRDIGHYANAGAAHNFLPLISPPANYPIRSYTSNARVGDMICAFGAISQWRCGQITRVGVVQVDQGQPTIINTTEATMCSRPGDSGGPAVFRSTATDMIGYAITVAIRSGATIGGGGQLEPNSNCFPNSNNIPSGSITILQPVLEYANRQNISLKIY